MPRPSAKQLHAELERLRQENARLHILEAERHQAELERLRLAAIVEFSNDAIISKDLAGAITSWNPSAERLYGYSAAEAIGQSIAMLIPADRPDEMPSILARLQHGE